MSTKTLLILLAVVTLVAGFVLMHGHLGDMSLGPIHVKVGH